MLRTHAMNLPSHLRIHRASSKDIDTLIELGRRTFSETFESQNTPENLSAYIKRAFTLEKLKSEIEDSHSEFYLLYASKEAVGYLKVNTEKAQTELQEKDSLEVERIYVLKYYHGQGMGLILLEKAIEIARQKKLRSIWLGVWERNHRALRFYQKHGFRVFDKHVFKMGNEDQTDLMMRLTL